MKFTIRQMNPPADGPDRYSNVWSFVINYGSNDVIFEVGAGEGTKHLFNIEGIKDAQGQPVSPLTWDVDENQQGPLRL